MLGAPVHGKVSVWHLSNVTADRQRETAAARARESLLSLYDTMPVGLVVVDDGGAIEHLNQTLGDWLGLSPAARGRPLRLIDFVAADSAELLRTIARGEGGQGQPIDVDLTGQQGETVAARLLLLPRTGDSGGSGFAAAADEAADRDGRHRQPQDRQCALRTVVRRCPLRHRPGRS